MNASPPAIRVEGLQKKFGDVLALQGVDFAVPAGTVLGLLGPNGAGKTTAVRVLTTILEPDGGRAEVLGVDVTQDPRGVRERRSPAGPLHRRHDPGRMWPKGTDDRVRLGRLGVGDEQTHPAGATV